MRNQTRLAIWCLSVAAAFSQTATDRAVKIQHSVFDPTLRSNVSAPNAQVAIEGSNDQGTVTGRIGVFVHDFVLETKLSAPIGKTAKEANLVDLSGMPNKGTADLGLTRTIWNPTADAAK